MLILHFNTGYGTFVYKSCEDFFETFSLEPLENEPSCFGAPEEEKKVRTQECIII